MELPLALNGAGGLPLRQLGRILPHDGAGQRILVGIIDLSGRLFLHTVFLLEGDAPFKEQAQAGTHGVASGLLHDEATLGDGLELICCQQGALHHLQALAGIVFASAHRAGEHRAAAEGFGEGIRCFTVGGKAAADHILAVIHQDGCAFFAIVLFQLRQRLDDGYQRQAARASSTEKRQNIKGRHGTQLIAKENNTVFQFAAVLIRYREQLTGEVLDH